MCVVVRLFRRRREAEPAPAEDAELDAAYEGATRATRRGVLGRLGGLLRGGKLDDDFWEELEETLILADMGGPTSARLVEELRDSVGRGDDADAVRGLLREQLIALLERPASDGALWSGNGAAEPPAPRIVLVVGVNGAGKTTSIAKLAHALGEDGQTVLLAAADTFRAAAIEQLQTWAQRVGVDCIAHQPRRGPRRGRLRRDRGGLLARHRHRHRRHRRPPANAVQPDGRAGQGAPCDRKPLPRRAPRSAAGARRDQRPERPQPGPPVHRRHRRHRHAAWPSSTAPARAASSSPLPTKSASPSASPAPASSSATSPPSSPPASSTRCSAKAERARRLPCPHAVHTRRLDARRRAAVSDALRPARARRARPGSRPTRADAGRGTVTSDPPAGRVRARRCPLLLRPDVHLDAARRQRPPPARRTGARHRRPDRVHRCGLRALRGGPGAHRADGLQPGRLPRLSAGAERSLTLARRSHALHLALRRSGRRHSP